MPWPLSMIARYTVKRGAPAECLDKTGRRPSTSCDYLFAGSFSYALERAANWAHDSPGGARLILADDAFSAELVPALLARGIDLGSRQIYVAAIAPQPIGEKLPRWLLLGTNAGGTPGGYFWETMAALQVASQYPDFPAQTLLGALNFDAQHESHPASFSLWLATHRGLQIVLTPEVSI